MEKFALELKRVTALPLEDRLKQHRMNGKNYKKLFLIDLFMDLNEARGYEEVIEELMTDPKHNKEHLFTNENNSLHPQRDKEFYEDATAWAVEDILERLQNKLNISLQTAEEYLHIFGKQIYTHER